MKVTLISPYLEIYSVGPRIISSVLKQEGIPVQMLFLPQDFHHVFSENNLNDIVALVKDSDIVGISLMSNQFTRVAQLTRAIRARTGCFVVWGGIHPTAAPEQSLEHVDAICIGEGEESFRELVQKIQRGEDVFTTRGFWFRKKGRIIRNDVRPLIKDLDSLPYPDYTYDEQLLFDNDRISTFTLQSLKKHLSNIYLTLASRGCPFSCAYCCNDMLKKLYGSAALYRRRSLPHLIGELREIREELPFVTQMHFEDDLFLVAHEDVIREFCGTYSRTIGLPFTVGGIAPGTINDAKLRMLVDAGLLHVRMGIQSTSEHMARLYNRKLSKPQITETIQLFQRFRKELTTPYYDFILDSPWETIDDRIDSLRFFATIPKPFKMNLFSLTFYPGTSLYARAKEEGLISDEEKDVYSKNYTFLKHTFTNALYYFLYCNSYLPLRIKNCILNKKLIEFMEKRPALGKISFMAAKCQYLVMEGLQDIFSGRLWRIAKFFQIRKIG